MNNQQAQLPEGWKIMKLGEVGKVSMCKRIFKEQTTMSGDIPFYKIGTFGKKADAFIAKEIFNEFRNKYSFPKKGDILISASGTIGRRVRYDGAPAYFQDSNIVWIDNDEKLVLNNYLYHFYNVCDWQSTKGATISRLYSENLKKIEIPFPISLPEQQRIVAILDECFASIDKAKANAEQNLRNAKELFESYLQGVFEKKCEGWEEKKLKELTTKIGSGATPRGGQKSYKAEGISLVRSMNVHDREFKEKNLAFIDEKQAKELDGVTLHENDVLLNITGASVARSCIIPKAHLPARVNQHVSIIRPKKEILDTMFLNLLLTSKPYKDKLLFTGEQGATRQAITKAQIEAFRIKFPILEQQQTIVRQLDALRTETQKLEAIYQKKIDDLEELKKSILQKAFAGELTTEKELVT